MDRMLQDNISWAIGFGIPAAAMVLAIVLFVAGAKNYTHVPPTERCSPAAACSQQSLSMQHLSW